ncbi:MAG: hypothetical protein NZT92_06330 [Abditibacteriales bacterium]|nr:hypothetical protein [Abditibacteriales bacterium]MDW8365550.1 hypothetical protein [Abditibacteriales bacterium]
MATPTQEEQAKAAQAAALAAWQAGQIANELYDKTQERPFSDRDVERVLKSKSLGVWRYRHEKGQPRYDFYHPETELFVAWQPDEEGYQSQIKTCFRCARIESYMNNQSDVVCLRQPKR